jgi:hypothetical protein
MAKCDSPSSAGFVGRTVAIVDGSESQPLDHQPRGLEEAVPCLALRPGRRQPSAALGQSLDGKPRGIKGAATKIV